MSEQEFWDTTPKAFFLKLESSYDIEQFKQQQEWERIRWQTALLVNMQLAKKDRIKKLTDLIEFDWDKKEPKKPPPTKAEIEQLIKKYGGKKD